MRDEGLSERLLLYAAGALEPAEAAKIEQRLEEGDRAVAQELSAARETLASVALALEPIEPSAELRARLLRRADSEGEPEAASPPEVPPEGPRWRSLAPALAAAVALLLGVGLGRVLTTAGLPEPAAEPAGEREEWVAEIDRLEQEVAELKEDARARELQVNLLRSPDLIVAVLAPTEAQPEAEARIFWAKDDYRCYLHSRGLEPPEQGELTLWIHTGDDRILRVGRLEPDFAGEATLFVELPRDVTSITRATVTLELDTSGDRPRGAEQLVWTAG